jgi:hypothetical protein
MPTTTKTRYSHYKQHSASGAVTSTGTVVCEAITSSTGTFKNGHWIGYNPVTHWKVLKPFEKFYSLSSSNLNLCPYKTGYNLWSSVPIGNILGYALSVPYIGLEFQDNNSFELIPFLLDFDDLLKSFVESIWKTFSYGGITWNLMPLYSDVSSLLETAKDINGNLLKAYEKILGKRITRQFNWVKEFPTVGWWQCVAEGVTRINGYVSGDLILPDTTLKAAQVFLDELGVNPDLKTVWDVIPFSFVADYFLPIGDLLESMHPRGWFNPQFRLTGGVSVKATISHMAYNGNMSDWAHYKYYYRAASQGSYGSRPQVEPEYECPSIREMFNTLYLRFSK